MSPHRGIVIYRGEGRTLGVRRASFDCSGQTRRDDKPLASGDYPSRGGDGVILGWVQPTGLAVFPVGCTRPTNGSAWLENENAFTHGQLAMERSAAMEGPRASSGEI